MNSTKHLIWLLCLAGCTQTPNPEGMNPGECSDGADNDADGYYDCNDIDCMLAPDCEESDTDTDTDSDTDTDTDTDTDVDIAAHLKSYSVDYTLNWNFDETGVGAALEAYGLGDCTNTYRGEGTQSGASGVTVTFEGSWELTGSTCHETLQDPQVAWYNPVTKTSFATFHFKDGLDLLDIWIQHRDEVDIDPLNSPNDNGQWYITAMKAPFIQPANTSEHAEMEQTTIEGLFPVELNHSVDVSFGL